MAPAKAGPPYAKDERVLCFHHEMLYEAKVLDSRATEDQSWQYKIHYKGWKNTWDDWVPQDRVRKFTEENKQLAAQLHEQMKALQGKPTPSASKSGKVKGRANGSDFSSARGSEERGSMVNQGGRAPRRARDYDLEQEDGFLSRPAIKLPIPDRIKAILVDDWENVTKNQQLVPLPCAHPVETILKDYEADELPKRIGGSPEAGILEEMLAGLREYFEKCLGRILLYRFERAQYLEMTRLWQATTGDLAGKNAAQTYGAEHLCRLLVSLPELIAQTNMDQQSVTRLREEIVKFTNWLVLKPNTTKYFVSEYENPTQSYIDKARGN